MTYLSQTLSTHQSWAAEEPKVKCSKTISNCLSNNFLKWISSSYICATYFELTKLNLSSCTKHLWPKKALRGITFYKNLLLKHAWMSYIQTASLWTWFVIWCSLYQTNTVVSVLLQVCIFVYIFNKRITKQAKPVEPRVSCTSCIFMWPQKVLIPRLIS